MSPSKASIALSFLGALLGAHALPASSSAAYAVKERHVVPRAWTAVGPASKSQLVNLQIGLKQRNQGLVERHLLEVSDPSHARYGQHLSAAEVNDIVAPSDETVGLVQDWLAEHEIENVGFSPAKDWVSIVVPIEKAEELLQTKYTTFRHRDGDEVSRAPVWSLPAHLHEHIDVVQPTTSFFRHRPNVKSRGPVRDGPARPLSWWEHTGHHLYGWPHNITGSHAEKVAAVCNASFTTPTCLRTLYSTLDYVPQAPGINKIGIDNYLNETNKRSDAELFLKTFRPEAASAANEFEIVTIAGAPDDQGPYTAEQLEDGTNIEGNLDAQLALSISWPTPLTAFSTGGSPPFIPSLSTPENTNEPYLVWLNYVLSQPDLPQVLSTSYGDDEQTVPLSYADRVCSGFAQLGARGISVLFSSGDSGVGSDGTCYSNTNTSQFEFLPAFPTSCPWVTSVGATANFNPETAVTRFASGAGFSNYFGAPLYQQATVNAYVEGLGGLHDGLYNKSGRAYPDVAAQGNRDAIVWAGNLTTVGGKKPLGFLNPWLYSGAYKTFTDVTIGSSFGCNSSGFPATEGWDAVTGFGTPNFPALVAAAFLKDFWPKN